MANTYPAQLKWDILSKYPLYWIVKSPQRYLMSSCPEAVNVTLLRKRVL
jgi:hypothetical protein